MKIAKKTSLLLSVAYHDIFNFALTRDELREWLPYIRDNKLTIPAFLGKVVENNCEYIVLPQRKAIVSNRHKYESESKIKWRIAREAAHKLSLIPSILMVGVTGGLAMNSVTQADDIDFFIVTRPGLLWITRLIVTLVFDALGQRRRPGDKNVSDMLCFNMFVTSDHVETDKTIRDLYMAHEITQLVPLISRNQQYEKFLTANKWVRKYLPNRYRQITKKLHIAEIANISPIGEIIVQWMLKLEFFARRMQYLYMRNRKTNEYISNNIARFHPVDMRQYVYKELSVRLIKYKIALDKVFRPF